MKKILLFGLLITVLVVLPLLTYCQPEASSTPTKEAKWWDKHGTPKYGGVITLRANSLSLTFDDFIIAGKVEYWTDSLWNRFNWALDREIWSYKCEFAPMEYYAGVMAESWEMTDSKTMTVHLKEGIKWQDNPPMNGREVTAYDVQYHYDRMMGTGSGFTEAAAMASGLVQYCKSVIATDKYTIQFNMKSPGVLGAFMIMEPGGVAYIMPREVVEQEGYRQNWEIAVGSGPFIIEDYIEGALLSLKKNPNYFGHDERHPENQIPYVDQFKVICIPDTSTALAALRTGKIDYMNDITWQQAQSIAKSNPELLQVEFLAAAADVEFRCDKMPFTDIRVRKALQMSIDRPTVANSYFGGLAEGLPAGPVNPTINGYCFPYKEWPQELKDEYSYDPERAQQLLAEAAKDGVFEPNANGGFDFKIQAPSNRDLALLQIFQGYFKEVGVEMEIEAMDPVAWRNIAWAGKHESAVFWSTSDPFPPTNTLWKRQTGDWGNYTFNNDSGYDALITEIQSATNWDDIQKLMIEADRYAIEHHWVVPMFPSPVFTIYQPYLKGYSGEFMGAAANVYCFARMWVDK